MQQAQGLRSRRRQRAPEQHSARVTWSLTSFMQPCLRPRATCCLCSLLPIQTMHSNQIARWKVWTADGVGLVVLFPLSSTSLGPRDCVICGWVP
eukprot:2817976-Rhodomonas_salina.1